MPFRSPKMYSFIFGFHRFVWWPKCTPASNRSFIAIPDNSSLPCSVATLAFTELETLARASETVLLPLLDARVGRQQPVLLQCPGELGVEHHESPGDAQPNRTGLTIHATAGHGRENVELVAVLGEHERPPYLHAQRVGGEV